MHSPRAAGSVLTVLIFWSSLIWVAHSSVFNAHPPRWRRQVQHRDADLLPSSTNLNNGTWPKFPYTVTINQSDSTPEWLQFSHGGQTGTQRQSLILSSLVSKLSATFAISPTDILEDMSNVSKQDVSVAFKLTPQFLNAKSYSAAVDKLASYVKQWGPKELDLKVGSGAVNSTTEGVFRIRFGQNNFTSGTDTSTTPPSKDTSAPAVKLGSPQPAALNTTMKEKSRAVSVSIGHSTNLPALASNVSQIRYYQNRPTLPTSSSITNTSQALRTFSVSATKLTGTPSAAQTTITISRSESVSTGQSKLFPVLASNMSHPLLSSTLLKSNITSSSLGLYTPLSTNRQTGNGTIPKSSLSASAPRLYTTTSGKVTPLSIQSSPLTTMTGGASPGAVSVAGGSGDTNEKAATAGAAAAASILAAGGSIAAAMSAAGEAASAAVVAAGGDAAAASAAKAAAEQAVRDSEDSEAEEEEERVSLSSANARGTATATGTPATTNPALTGLTTILATNTRATTAPTITTPTTTAPVTLSLNGTMTSQVVSSSCAACATCPGFDFGAKWPDLGSTTSWADSDMDTEDDWDADEDDDEFSPEDANGEEGDVPESQALPRRELRGHFNRFANKKSYLHKRMVAAKKSTSLGKCTGFTKFSSKPPYYNAMNVATFEQTPGMMDKYDQAAMAALLRWAIPISVPPGDCTTVPIWEYLTTTMCLGDAPLKDGSTFSKAVGVGEQVWQVGGAPNQINKNREVNIDHVYEAKYLDDFFEDLTVNQGFDCKSLMDMWDSKDGSTLTNLFAELPSKTNTEFIGMAKGLNSLKEAVTNKIWNKDLPLSWVVYGRKDKTTGIKGPDTTVGLAFTITGKDAQGNEVSFDPANDLNELTTAAQILDLINTPKAISYMSAPNDRIYTALQAHGVPCQGGPSWADRYKSYILNRFATRNVQIQDLFNRVLTKIGTGYRSDYIAAWKKIYPLEHMQLPPPTSWAAEFPAIQQAIQAKFDSDPASLGKRQVGSPPAAGACMRNVNATAVTAVSTGFQPSSAPPPQTTPATTTAAPVVALPATSQASTTASAAPSKGDPCGPAIQDNPNYPNTCAAKPQLGTTPQQYGILCGWAGPSSIDWTACEQAVEGACENMLWTQYPKGAWVWTDPGNGCAVGTWMPTGTDGQGAGAAMTPSTSRCHDLIFKAMTDTCSGTGSGTNLASVNLATLPSFSDLKQTGSQVNVGYPTYLVAGKSPKGLNKLPWNFGWSTAQFDSLPGKMNANNQNGLTESMVV